MGAGGSGLFNSTRGGNRPRPDTPLTVNRDKQNRHDETSKNYKEGRSRVSLSLEECQSLINKFAGKGIPKGNDKEVVDFGRVIGYYVDNKTGMKYLTTRGTIHYSKTGTHIVPGHPIWWQEE